MTPARATLMTLPFVALMACFPTTTRPSFLPQPLAPTFEIALNVPDATRALALALGADSIPVSRTEAKDGWLETGWFELATRHQPTRRVLGTDIVKLRAFVDPSRPNHSAITVEIVYQPLADPSRPERQLEQELPAAHPFVARIVDLTTRLTKRFEVGGDSVAAPVKKP